MTEPTYSTPVGPSPVQAVGAALPPDNPQGLTDTPQAFAPEPVAPPATVGTTAPVVFAKEGPADIELTPDLLAAFQAFMNMYQPGTQVPGANTGTGTPAAEPTEVEDESHSFLTKFGTTIYKVGEDLFSKDAHNSITVEKGAAEAFDVVKTLVNLLHL